MKARVRVGDRVEIAEGHYWPHSKLGTVVRKDPIISGKRILSHWFIVRPDHGIEGTKTYSDPEPLLLTRSQITLLPREGESGTRKAASTPAAEVGR